jgi:hypothetical protein
MSIEIKVIAFLLALITLIAAALGIYHIGYVKGDALATQRDDLKFTKFKNAAAQQLTTETAKVLAAERELATFKSQQEIQDAEHQKTVATLSDRLRHAAGPAGRLRDPNAAGCGSGGGVPQGAAASAPGDRADDHAEASGLLSARLTGLLQQLTREADDINDALNVRGP